MKMSENYVKIDEQNIYYSIHGHGPSTVLLLHGPVGSSKDFEQQINKTGLDPNEFTIITMDLPGYGKSTPLKREFTIDSFNNEAHTAAKLMRHLNHKTYSVLGWSDGAKVASLIAINYPSRVNNLILWGFIPFMDKKSCQAIGRTRDVEIWDPLVLKRYQETYGEEEFAELWHRYVDFVVSSLEFEERFDIRLQLKTIKCPTLVLHGDADPIVDYNDHIKPLHYKIYDSDIGTFPHASHNLHQVYPKKFNRMVSQFIIASRA